MKSIRNSNKDRRLPAVNYDTVVYGKVPPQATELERAVLGAILNEKKAIYEVIELLSAEQFYVDAHQRIYAAIIRLERKGIGIDIFTAIEELRSSEELDVVGGPYFITKLTNDVVSSAHIKDHCHYIIQTWVKRSVIKIGMEMIRQGYEDGTDCFDMLDQASGEFYAIENTVHSTKSVTKEQMVAKFINDREAAVLDPSKLVYTGYAEWDRINGPLQKGMVYVIAARPAMGKTAFVVQMIQNMAQKVPVGFVNLEMTHTQMVQRFISNSQKLSNIHYKIKPGGEQDPEWVTKKIMDGGTDFINLNLHILNDSDLTVEKIISKLTYWVLKFGIKAAFVDFLQLVKFTEERERYHTRLENINYTLDRLVSACKRLDIPLILLCQLNRDVMKRGGSHEPIISDLKDSGKIEEMAYQISFLHRPEVYEIFEDANGASTHKIAYQIIAKHKDGELGKPRYIFEGEISSFTDYNIPRFDAPATFDAPVNTSLEDNDEGININEALNFD